MLVPVLTRVNDATFASRSTKSPPTITPQEAADPLLEEPLLEDPPEDELDLEPDDELELSDDEDDDE